MNKKLSLSLVFASLISISSLSSCNLNKIVDIRQIPVQKYFAAKNSKERFEIECQYCPGDYQQQDLSFITWDPDLEYYSYRVYFADNKEFNNPYIVYTTSTVVEGGIFVPGKTYYYKVIASDDYDIIRDKELDDSNYPIIKKGKFKVKDDIIRFVNIPGMFNTRDIGGYKAEHNKRIKYEMVYRGGYFLRIDDDGVDIMKNRLNIKTEIDLRVENDRPDKTYIGNVNSLDPNLNYVEAPITTCSYMFPQWNQTEPYRRSYFPLTQESLYKAFSCLSDESNYPVYLHCNAGADRTGTFAFLLEGLLGVEIDDLALDFEMTCFSAMGTSQWRGPIVDGERVMGVAQDDTKNYVGFGLMYENMLKWYGVDNGAKDNSLQAAIENYFTSFIGITDEQISSIKSILLE